MTDLGLSPKTPRRRQDDDEMIERLASPAILNAIRKIGALPIIAMGLAGFLVMRVQSWQDKADVILTQQQQATSAILVSTERIGAAMQQEAIGHGESNRRLELLLQQLCVNTSRNFTERNECYAIVRGR